MGHLGHGDTNGLKSAADGELLTLFAATRDEEAFTELVRRHSGLVFGVCRRVTGNHHLAEDAFQAVFVVLATKAGAVRPQSAVAAWLHGVAWRTAMRARTMANRRQRREALVAARPEPTLSSTDEVPDAVAILDEEIAHLPEHYRLPLVLCELEGQDRKEVAGKLRIPEGTLSSRLAAARKRLADRLRQRGIALSTAAVTAAIAQAASARSPAALAAKAALAATRETIPAPVAALSYGVLRIMFLDKLKITIPLAMMAGGLLACAALAAVPPTSQPIKPQSLTTPTILIAAKSLDPVPAKVEPKPLPKGPNKLLIYRAGHLAMIDPDGKNEIKVGEGGEKFRSGPDPRLSPDGKKLAVLVLTGMPQPDGSPPQRKLYVRELNEKEPGTDLDITTLLFVWSPDGTKIATTDVVNDPVKKQIAVHYLVDVRTKERKSLKLPDDHVITDWSRDGKYFVTTSITQKDDKRKLHIHLMNMDGTEHKVLTDEQDNAQMGRISPDGTRVLYCKGTDTPTPANPQELGVLDIATGKKIAVSDLPQNGDIQGYCWSPDGKQIAYTWREKHEGKPEDLINKETESHLVICDPDGKNQKTIASEKGQGQWIVTIGQVDWR
jgi:RNA polymerase sigma factor (sigma-70 family)